MPAERLAMRRVREVLRLRHALGMSDRSIAQSLAIGKTTVGEYVCRAKVIGITWPVPEEIDDAELERRMFMAPSFEEKPTRPPLDWPRLHEELKRRGVTLMLLWLEYGGNEPDGFGYSAVLRPLRRLAPEGDGPPAVVFYSNPWTGQRSKGVPPPNQDVPRTDRSIATAGAFSSSVAALAAPPSARAGSALAK